jgi:hypothetical protein
MPIFSKPNAIVYVRHSGVIIAGKKLNPARLTFDPEQIENMEVVSDDSFTDNLRDFFATNGLKGKHILMVLDDSIVFSKTVPLDTDGKPSDIADTYIEAMPFSPGQRACLRVLSESELRLFATNGQLYLAIADALDQAGAGRLLAITPAAAYPTTGKQQLAAAVQQYVNDTIVRSKANFQDAPLV